jgi:hypothetical protein
MEFDAPNNRYVVTFNNGYNIAQDGCVFSATIAGRAVVGQYQDGTPVDLTPCAPGNFLSSRTREGDYVGAAVQVAGASTLWHPLANCKTYAEAITSTDPNVQRCDFRNRNFDALFAAAGADLTGPNTPQIFRSEMAAMSWNLLMFLVATSCDVIKDDISGDPECFNPQTAYAPDRCSFAAPQFCANAKGFLGVGSPNRNKIKAGGNANYGRRDFIWDSGGELALRYAKRNVFGISTDFAEDVTKTNWGVEFTWVGATPFLDANDFERGVTDSDALNLTVSIDRPTFINFLNPNRTFFFNTQWFFNYLTNYESSFSTNGPFNVLFTFAMFTGYYQDRLLPTMVTVFDFGSHSAGLLPSIAYRFNEAFSVTTGINYFFGHSQYKDMPVRGFAPTSGRAGKHAYQDGVENVLTAISRRDEVYVRLRYTF